MHKKNNDIIIFVDDIISRKGSFLLQDIKYSSNSKLILFSQGQRRKVIQTILPYQHIRHEGQFYN